MARNNHDRPEFSGSNLTQLLSEVQDVSDLSIVFNQGRICDISTNDPALLTYLRSLHHLERYQFLKQFLTDSEVQVSSLLEVGVGEGNGLNELLDCPAIKASSENLIGLEIDPQIASKCQQNQPYMTVVKENILEYSPGQTQFDLVICFELIGNESLKSDELLLQKIKSMTASGGYVAMSIAIFDESDYGRKRKKYYSSRIYNRQTFVELFEQVFPGCEKSFFGQYYPLKRFRDSETGVWPNPQLNKMCDFAVVVIKNEN